MGWFFLFLQRGQCDRNSSHRTTTASLQRPKLLQASERLQTGSEHLQTLLPPGGPIGDCPVCRAQRGNCSSRWISRRLSIKERRLRFGRTATPSIIKVTPGSPTGSGKCSGRSRDPFQALKNAFNKCNFTNCMATSLDSSSRGGTRDCSMLQDAEAHYRGMR